MTTYELPTEPPNGTRLVDKEGTVWAQGREGYWFDADENLTDWRALLFAYGPLTEVPAPALPTEDGALIIASGTSDGEPFENVALMLDCGQWNGRVPGGAVHLHSMTYDTDEITSWTEAVAVPKDKLDTLRGAANRPTTDDLHDLRATLYAAEALIDAVDGAA